MENFLSLAEDIIVGIVIIVIVFVSLFIITVPIVVGRGGVEAYLFFENRKYCDKQGTF